MGNLTFALLQSEPLFYVVKTKYGRIGLAYISDGQFVYEPDEIETYSLQKLTSISQLLNTLGTVNHEL